MTFVQGTEEYYQRFIELQEKLRKSEEERLKLEMKFNDIMRSTKDEEQTYIKKLRLKYKIYLEEDRKRQERNEKIMRILERIESRAAILTRKTERFQMLRRNYHAYLRRICQQPIYQQKISEKEPTPQNQEQAKARRTLFSDEPNSQNQEESKKDILKKYFESIDNQRPANYVDQLRTQSQDRVRPSPRSYEDLLQASDDIYLPETRSYASNIADDILNSLESRQKREQRKNQRENVWDKWKSNNDQNYQNKQLSDSLKSLRKSLDDLNAETDDATSNAPSENQDPVKYSFYSKKEDETNKNKTVKTPTPEDDDEYFKDLDKRLAQYNKEYNTTSKEAENVNKDDKGKDILATKTVSFDEDTLTEKGIGSSTSKEKDDVSSTNIMKSTSGNNEQEIADTDKLINVELKKPDATDTTCDDINNTKVSSDTSKEVESSNNDDVLKDNISKTSELKDLPASSDDANKDSSSKPETGDSTNNADSTSNIVESTQYANNAQYNAQYDPNYQQNQQYYQNNGQYQQYYPQAAPRKGPRHWARIHQNIRKIVQNPYVFGYDPNQAYHGQYYDNQQYYNENPQYDQYGNLVQYDQNQQYYNEYGQPVAYDPNQPQQNAPKQTSEDTHSNKDNKSKSPSPQPPEDAKSEKSAEETKEGSRSSREATPPKQSSGDKTPSPRSSSQNEVTVPSKEGSPQPVKSPVQQQQEAYDQQYMQYDEHGNPIQYDQYGQPIYYSEDGQYGYDPNQQYDEYGQPYQYDEHGQPIQYGSDGQPLQYDETGQPIQYDENGQPIYNYDQYPDQSQYPQQKESYPDPNAIQNDPKKSETDDSKSEKTEKDVSSSKLNEDSLPTDPQQENKSESPAKEEKIEEEKAKNVLEMLETDTESTKQDATKTSTSDFDFSNG